ncbi:MAG: thermonuclease family protein [Pelolinea sp.]|nr:thermonuclease family protein [Pelolinea sp.]
MPNRPIGLLLLVSLFLAFSGCNWLEPPSGENNLVPSATFISATKSANKQIYMRYACVRPYQKFETGYVVRVIDGDSIEVKVDGKNYEVRYIGVNAPEYESKERDCAILSKQENEKLLLGKKVYLFKDVSETDKFGRLLRYVFTDTAFVNLELVRNGYAEVKLYPPDVSCHDLFKQYDQSDFGP